MLAVGTKVTVIALDSHDKSKTFLEVGDVGEVIKVHESDPNGPIYMVRFNRKILVKEVTIYDEYQANEWPFFADQIEEVK